MECNLNSILNDSANIASSTTERNDIDPSESTPNSGNICISNNTSGTPNSMLTTSVSNIDSSGLSNSSLLHNDSRKSNSMLTTSVSNIDSSGLFNSSLLHNNSRNPNNVESPSCDSNTDSMRNEQAWKTADSNVTVHEEPLNKYLKQPIKI